MLASCARGYNRRANENENGKKMEDHMTDAELLARFTDISEKNLFPVQFGDGSMLIGLPPNDIYQLGFFAAFNECHLAVREYVDQMIVKGILDQQKKLRGDWKND